MSRVLALSADELARYLDNCSVLVVCVFGVCVWGGAAAAAQPVRVRVTEVPENKYECIIFSIIGCIIYTIVTDFRLGCGLDRSTDTFYLYIHDPKIDRPAYACG